MEKAGDAPGTRTKFSTRLYGYGPSGMTRKQLMHDNITPAETLVERMSRPCRKS